MAGFENKQKIIYLALKKQLEYLKQIKSYNLSDYYDNEYFKYIYNGINDILAKNDISDDIKAKTKGLIKWRHYYILRSMNQIYLMNY